MGLKLSFFPATCPGCGEPMIAHDLATAGLYLAHCKSCGKEWEIRKGPDGEIREIKPKTIS
jgi:uncharacterized Zn finger protein